MDTFDTIGDGQKNFEEYQAMRTLMDQRFALRKKAKERAFTLKKKAEEKRNEKAILTLEGCF